MIDGLVYGAGCGLLLIGAAVIGAVLHQLFGPLFGPSAPSITGGKVIGERLTDRSVEYWHREQSNRYDREK